MPTNLALPSRAILRRTKPVLVLLAGLLIAAGSAGAAIFVKIPGVPGEVTTEGYNDGTWSEALSGSYGVERGLVDSCNDGTADLNIGVGRLLPIGVASRLNSAAGRLAQAAANGNSVGEVEIHLVDLEPVPVTFCIIKLQDAFVKDFTMESSGTDRPWYQAFFVYNAIKIINRPTGPSGPEEQVVSWHVETEDSVAISPEMQAWLDTHFTPAQQADPDIGGLLADLDKDGLSTVMEFKLATNPRNGTDGSRAVAHAMVEEHGEEFLQITFVQRTDASTPDIRLVVQAGEDLGTWQCGPEVVALLSRAPLGNDLERLTYRLTRPRSEMPRQFVRLSVEHGL